MIDLTKLRATVQSRGCPELVFFYGHFPQPDGQVGVGCLSQWWSAPFEVDGERYPTAEHFMMAEKARLFRDEETRTRILRAKGPGSAQRLGRLVCPFDEGYWAQHRVGVVVRGNLAKFGQHPALCRYLLSTGDSVLAQASPMDRIWGIGFAEDRPEARNPLAWTGLNLLGFALMEVRQRLGATRGTSAV